MNESYAIRRYEQAASLLPLRWQRLALQLPDHEKVQAEELRLRTGQPMTAVLPQGEVFAEKSTPRTAVTSTDLEQLCDMVTGYSRYAAAETLRMGYLQAAGGFRVGLCGTAVMQEGAVTNLRDFSSATIRISREMVGLANDIVPQLLEDGLFPGTLIYSPPGAGKTTLLRDMVRLLSDGGEGVPAFRVALADERGEIAVMHAGQPQMAVGCHTDVLENCPKAEAVMLLLRSANPQIIAVDEITRPEDIRAMTHAANCGASILATIHAGSREELQHKPLFAELLKTGAFRRCVAITGKGADRRYEVGNL